MAFVAFLQKAAWASQIVYDGKAESIAQQKRGNHEIPGAARRSEGRAEGARQTARVHPAPGARRSEEHRGERAPRDHGRRRRRHAQARDQADEGDARGSIKAGNNQERTDLLAAQVEILESYLPKQVSGDELIALIEKTLTETGATSKKEMGKVMGALTKATGGNFDKAAAAAELGKRLA